MIKFIDRSSIDYAEGQVFPFNDESVIGPDYLQTIDYFGPRQRISYQLNEFATVCRFLGLSDTVLVWIDYISQKKLFELKSMKYYFISFRNVDFFQEDVTSRIFNDLNPLVEPEELLIKTRFGTPRRN